MTRFKTLETLHIRARAHISLSFPGTRPQFTTRPLSDWTPQRPLAAAGASSGNQSSHCSNGCLSAFSSPLPAAVVLVEAAGVDQRRPGGGGHVGNCSRLDVTQGLWLVGNLFQSKPRADSLQGNDADAQLVSAERKVTSYSI